jgi:hypothetical protein
MTQGRRLQLDLHLSAGDLGRAGSCEMPSFWDTLSGSGTSPTGLPAPLPWVWPASRWSRE